MRRPARRAQLGRDVATARPCYRRCAVDILLAGRPDLSRWEWRPFWPGAEMPPRDGDRRDCFERVVGREWPGEPEPNGPFRRVAAAIVRFDVFPPALVTPVLRRMPIEIGDTVGVYYRTVVPGVAFFFASRVVDRFAHHTDGRWRAGFTYRTLRGHPELGQETFCVEKDDAGEVLVALRSWSRPGTRLARALAPFVRLVQVRANESALAHLEEVARSAPSAGTRRS